MTLRAVILGLGLLAATLPAYAAPAKPQASAQIAALEVGVFCALQAMDRMPAPGTASGWLHVPRSEVSFHWPGRQVVPAALGLAFGVKATGAPGFVSSATTETRVLRPGASTPEVWANGISDGGYALSFFRFDSEDELITGIWSFESWDGETRLYRVEFEVVPAEAVPEITSACGATS